MNRTSILLVEDHTVMREWLRGLLALESDFEVIEEAVDGRQAVASVKKLRPDVVLMDIAMPLLNGFEATRQMLKSAPGIKVVILSAHSEDAYFKKAAQAGATGFLIKQTSSLEVCEAIRAVSSGKTY